MAAHAALRWEALTWEEIAALRRAGTDLCLLPCGATEQHGPHLGVGMDTVNAALLCEAVSARTRVPMLPALAYGCSLGHSHRWPGTIALQPHTLAEVITQIYTWIHAAGFRRLFLVNGHVGNSAPLRCALELIRSRHDDALIRLVNVAETSPEVRTAFYADAEDWHANAAETALMLALAPALVRPRKIKSADDPDRTAGLVFTHPVNRTSKNGVTGTPSRATRRQGQRLHQRMVTDLVELVERGRRENAPLNHSYFTPVK